MKQRERYIVWGVILLAAVLRFFTLGDRPFDGDEGVILKIAELPWRDLIAASAVDVHPPLYHLLVHWSISLFGVSEWSVRLVGVLAGIGLVALAPFLGSTLPDRQAGLRVPGWLLGLLLATSPYLVNLSQDARMYSLLVFLATSLWIVTYRLSTDRSNAWPWWLGWSLLALATVYTHHIGWLIVGLQALLLVWNLRQRISSASDRLPRRDGYLVTRISTIAGILILGYLPILSNTIAQVQGRLAEQSASAGIGDTLRGVVGGLYRMLAGRTFLDLKPGAIIAMITENPLGFAALIFTLLVPIIVLVLGFSQRDRLSSTDEDGDVPHASPLTPYLRTQTIAIIISSLAVALVIGSIGTQASRYLSFLAPLIYAFLGIGILRVWPFSWGKAATVVIALTFLAGVGAQYFSHNQAAGDDVYAQAITRELKEGDVVLLRGAFAGGEERVFQYYAAQFANSKVCTAVSPGSTCYPIFPGLKGAVDVVDLFADYDVRKRNLDELRAVDPAQKAVELLNQEGIKRVWYFDNSYQQSTLEQLPPGYVGEVVDLGVTDKEGKQLLLTKVTRQ